MKQRPSPAPALTRGFQLLEQLAVDGQSSLEKLAARNQWPKSSVYRVLQALEKLGAVQQDPASRRWRAMQRLQPLDAPALPPLEQARTRLASLAQVTGHCAELYALQSGHLTLIDRAEPENAEVMIRARIGFERDLEELDATALITYAFSPSQPMPPKSWVWKNGKQKKLSREKREQRIQKTADQSQAMDSDFNEYGIRRFAVPVLHGDNLAGVLVVAQRQTPRAESETDLIKQALQLPN